MTKPQPPDPQPTSGTNRSIYLWPRSTHPGCQAIYDRLRDLGWRYDKNSGMFYTPEGEPEAFGALETGPMDRYEYAKIITPSTVKDGIPYRGRYILELDMTDSDAGDGMVWANPYEARQCPECKVWIYTAGGPFADDDPTKTLADIDHWEAEHGKPEDTMPGAAGATVTMFPLFDHNQERVKAQVPS